MFSLMKKTIFILIAIFAMFSCVKQDRDNMIANQESNIDSYISSLGNVRVQNNSGVNRIVFKEGDGLDSLSVGDSVKFYYTGYVFSRRKGSMFVTNVDSVAKANNFVCAKAPENIKLEGGNVVDGLFYGLQGAKVGERCEIVFSAKYGYGNTVVYNIPKMTPLIFEVQIVEIVKN